jgi:hypothetical protein
MATQPIQPVNLPQAAGIDYGTGDVRHFAQGDDMSVPGISNPTRQLAQRDNILASALNQVIESVNNQEQFVPLPIVRTIVPASDQTVVLNYRIPPGFESRILDAIVTSNPVSPDIELDIYYNPGFGGCAGTAVVTTSTEFVGGVNFYQQGEFVVALNNKSGAALEMAASVLLTLRPVGTVGTLLVGSVVQGPVGQPGQAGPPGPPGPPGSAGIGSPGMIWTGTWSDNTVYTPNQVVRFDLGGVGFQVSSFICVLAHNSSNLALAPNGYQTNGAWNAVALAGGPGAGINWLGAWSPTGVYAVGDGVSYVVNGVTTSYVCVSAVGPSAAPPVIDTADWDILAGPTSGTASTYSFYPVPGTLWFASDFVAGGTDGNYEALGSANGASVVSMQEADLVNDNAAPQGIALLQYQLRQVFCGTETLVLPQPNYGAAVQWDSTQVDCAVTIDGTASANPDHSSLVKVTATANGSYNIVIANALPVKASISVFGFQQIGGI